MNPAGAADPCGIKRVPPQISKNAPDSSHPLRHCTTTIAQAHETIAASLKLDPDKALTLQATLNISKLFRELRRADPVEKVK
jgi:hypothetical protein